MTVIGDIMDWLGELFTNTDIQDDPVLWPLSRACLALTGGGVVALVVGELTAAWGYSTACGAVCSGLLLLWFIAEPEEDPSNTGAQDGQGPKTPLNL